jgi:hypothetical protein
MIRAMDAPIAVIDQSTLAGEGEVAKVVAALATQVSRDWAPRWFSAGALFVSTPEKVPTEAWQLVILDDSDQADALGYHELSNSGTPLGKVFVRSVRQSGGIWSVAASHELLEMLADPDINLAAEGYDPDDPETAAFYAYEVCDPVEGDVYAIDGVQVSDFVTPEYFEIDPPPESRFDHLGLLTAPFTLRPGGYMSVLPIGKSARWKQIFGDAAPALRVEAKPGGRRSRRMLPRRQWRRSRK